MAVTAPAEGPWLPDERPALAAAFRQCVGLLLKACGQPVALPGVHNMRAWMLPLIGVRMKLWLHVYEERAEDHDVVGCDACRIIGEQLRHKVQVAGTCCRPSMRLLVLGKSMPSSTLTAAAGRAHL